MVNTKHQKVSKSSGKNAPLKKSGYAAGDIPDSMMPNKVGLTNHKGYTGPDVATGTHKG